MSKPDVPANRSLPFRAAAVFTTVLSKAVTSLNALGTMIIIALMVLICADVVGRNLLSTSLPGVIELAELSIVSIVFLQIADTLKSGKLMRSDVVIKVIETRLPRLGMFMNAMFDATGAVLFYFIAKGAFGRFFDAWTGGFYLGNQGSFTAPTWPMELCVALGSSLVGFLFVTSTVANIAALLGLRPAVVRPGDDL